MKEDDIHIRDAMSSLRGRQIYFLELAFYTGDYDIIICLIFFIQFIDYKNDFWTEEVIDFLKVKISKDSKLKELLTFYKNKEVGDKLEDIYTKVRIKNWIKDIIIIERERKLMSIL